MTKIKTNKKHYKYKEDAVWIMQKGVGVGGGGRESPVWIIQFRLEKV